ncbi:flagellar basal body P-ring formation chaperone FlgA [uncultured Ferrimonas sp.]|uniref:flagellar basal body P-ring formation chaperone FlgA n=1 Tax=uncultured Ferrimonas sp. TaxID=432640 RepID=UPI002634D5B3|nr:flagellar basal body P-ring formation chaperone FlgA [uncultured Ferrimonas sp.]
MPTNLLIDDQQLNCKSVPATGSRPSLWLLLLWLISPLASAATDDHSANGSRVWLQQQFSQQLSLWQRQQPGTWGKTQLQLGQQTLADCHGTLQLARPLPANPLGPQRLQLRCSQPQWSQRLRVEFRAQARVWLAKSEIQREQIISPAQLQSQWRWLTGRDNNLVLAQQQIVGQRSLRRIKANTPIKSAYLAAPWWVSKGQEVVIRAERDGFAASSKGVALGSANAGQTVKIRNSRSGKVISAYVIEKGVVQTRF